MKLTTLTIRRKQSYEDGAELKATADFEGPGGKVHVELAPGFIVRVLSLIESDAAERARTLAASVSSAMGDAIDDTKLIEADSKTLQLPETLS